MNTKIIAVTTPMEDQGTQQAEFGNAKRVKVSGGGLSSGLRMDISIVNDRFDKNRPAAGRVESSEVGGLFYLPEHYTCRTLFEPDVAARTPVYIVAIPISSYSPDLDLNRILTHVTSLQAKANLQGQLVVVLGINQMRFLNSKFNEQLSQKFDELRRQIEDELPDYPVVLSAFFWQPRIRGSLQQDKKQLDLDEISEAAYIRLSEHSNAAWPDTVTGGKGKFPIQTRDMVPFGEIRYKLQTQFYVLQFVKRISLDGHTPIFWSVDPDFGSFSPRQFSEIDAFVTSAPQLPVIFGGEYKIESSANTHEQRLKLKIVQRLSRLNNQLKKIMGACFPAAPYFSETNVFVTYQADHGVPRPAAQFSGGANEMKACIRDAADQFGKTTDIIRYLPHPVVSTRVPDRMLGGNYQCLYSVQRKQFLGVCLDDIKSFRTIQQLMFHPRNWALALLTEFELKFPILKVKTNRDNFIKFVSQLFSKYDPFSIMIHQAKGDLSNSKFISLVNGTLEGTVSHQQSDIQELIEKLRVMLEPFNWMSIDIDDMLQKLVQVLDQTRLKIQEFIKATFCLDPDHYKSWNVNRLEMILGAVIIPKDRQYPDAVANVLSGDYELEDFDEKMAQATYLSNQVTLLHIAVLMDDAALVERLVELKSNILAQTGSQVTALQIAFARENYGLLSYLIEELPKCLKQKSVQGLPTVWRDADQNSLLHLMAGFGSLSAYDACMSVMPTQLKEKNASGLTPVQYALFLQNSAIWVRFYGEFTENYLRLLKREPRVQIHSVPPDQSGIPYLFAVAMMGTDDELFVLASMKENLNYPLASLLHSPFFTAFHSFHDLEDLSARKRLIFFLDRPELDFKHDQFAIYLSDWDNPGDITIYHVFALMLHEKGAGRTQLIIEKFEADFLQDEGEKNEFLQQSDLTYSLNPIAYFFKLQFQGTPQRVSDFKWLPIVLGAFDFSMERGEGLSTAELLIFKNAICYIQNFDDFISEYETIRGPLNELSLDGDEVLIQWAEERQNFEVLMNLLRRYADPVALLALRGDRDYLKQFESWKPPLTEAQTTEISKWVDEIMEAYSGDPSDAYTLSDNDVSPSDDSDSNFESRESTSSGSSSDSGDDSDDDREYSLQS